jgi:hypothetical protein
MSACNQRMSIITVHRHRGVNKKRKAVSTRVGHAELTTNTNCSHTGCFYHLPVLCNLIAMVFAVKWGGFIEKQSRACPQGDVSQPQGCRQGSVWFQEAALCLSLVCGH